MVLLMEKLAEAEEAKKELEKANKEFEKARRTAWKQAEELKPKLAAMVWRTLSYILHTLINHWYQGTQAVGDETASS